MAKFALIDIDIREAENGMFVITSTAHTKPSPGDSDPVQLGDCVECETSEGAQKFAHDRAKLMVAIGEAETTVVFMDGSQIGYYQRVYL